MKKKNKKKTLKIFMMTDNRLKEYRILNNNHFHLNAYNT